MIHLKWLLYNLYGLKYYLLVFFAYAFKYVNIWKFKEQFKEKFVKGTLLLSNHFNVGG